MAHVCHPRGMTEGRRSQAAVILGVVTWIVLAQFTGPLIGILAGLGVGVATWLLTSRTSPPRQPTHQEADGDHGADE